MNRVEIPEQLFGPEFDRVVEDVMDRVLNRNWDEYIALVRQVEALPENRSGADKTWVEEALEVNRLHYGKPRKIIR